MPTILNSVRVLLMTALGLFSVRSFTAGQTSSPSHAVTPGDYRIAGTVVSKTDGHPLANVRITVRDAKDPQKFEFQVTSEAGKFQFNGVPAGKYQLIGAKRGFIAASFDQHEQFSTAIVTGPGLETEALVLRLAPAAIIAGKILDEAGEPVRHATVTVYRDDHSSGVDRIQQFRTAQTDDQGAYEVASLVPGTYFLSANAKPWYAVHPNSTDSGTEGNSADPATLTRALDVAYPLTYYSDVIDADSATPIPIRGGERLQVEIHLSPVPSLRLLFRVPTSGNNGFSVPRLEQPAFDGSTFFQNDGVRMVSPGLVELTGIPAGRYNLDVNGPGAALRMNGVDLNKDGEEIDTSKTEALTSVKVTIQVTGEAAVPPHLSVALRSGGRLFTGVQAVSEKGEAEFPQVAAGRYEIVVWSPTKQFSITHLAAVGAEVSAHSITVTAGTSVSVSLTVLSGSLRVDGTAKRASKPFAGAMVVLVPKGPERDRDLFRRDQSDLDGTFSLQNVVPGSYTVLAIENGWDLDWSQPGVIAAYLKRGRAVEIGNQSGRIMNLSDAVEVQSK